MCHRKAANEMISYIWFVKREKQGLLILRNTKKYKNVYNSIIFPSSNHYVAVCNNYAICNTLQTALNCNAVCNTSYFKLRCEGNAICNVLQIASKFYHLKILKRRKKLINCKMHRFNNILLWIQLDTNLFELGMQNSQSTLHLVRTLFCPRTFAKFGCGGH